MIDKSTLESLEIAEQFFAEMGLPFSWHVDQAGELHAWATVDVDPPARKGAERPSAGGRRRR